MAYVYQGVSKKQAEKIIETTMKPLENDFEPDPIMGGFPPPSGGNPSKYYPADKDRPKQLQEKQARREKYRELRLLEAKKPGDTVRVLIARRGMLQEKEVVLGVKAERNFRIQPMPDPNPLQASILEDWLKDL